MTHRIKLNCWKQEPPIAQAMLKPADPEVVIKAEVVEEGRSPEPSFAIDLALNLPVPIELVEAINLAGGLFGFDFVLEVLQERE